jgi:hypothetical protein
MTSEHEGDDSSVQDATFEPEDGRVASDLDLASEGDGVIEVADVEDLEDDQLRTVMLALDDAESLPVQDRLDLLQRTEGLLAASLEALDGL